MKNRFPYSKKFIAAALAIAVAVPGTSALASVASPTKGNIELKVLDDDKITVKAGVAVKISKTFDGTAIPDVGTNDFSGTTNASGLFTSADLDPGTYYVTIADDAPNETTTVVNVKADKKGTAPTKATLVLVDATTADPSTTGLISDIVYGTNGTSPVGSGIKVSASNGTTTWETTTDGAGKFSLYVPAGKYNITVDPDPLNDTLKNMYYPNLVVTAGQKTSTFNALNGAQPWDLANKEEELGFKLDQTISNTSNNISVLSGTANVGTTVSVYDMAGTKTLIASAVAKKGKDAGGTFSIKLPVGLGGKTVMVEVKDQAGNKFSKVPAGVAVDNATGPTLTADTTANSIDKAIDLTFTDTSKLFAPSVTSVETRKAGTLDAFVPLDKTKKQYTVSNGKITIAAGVLKEGSNDILVKATGFTDSTRDDQDITVATLNATPTKGSANGNGGVKFTYAPASGNYLMYKVTNIPTVTAPLYRANMTTLGATDYTVGADITGVDALTNKYVVLYEVKKATTANGNAFDEVVKYKVIPLTLKVIAADTAAPTASVTAATVIKPAPVTTGKSTEAGTTYLVSSTATVTSKASLDALVTAGTASKATVTTNTAVDLVTTGLVAGPYKVYAVDAAGNVSAPSTGLITVQ